MTVSAVANKIHVSPFIECGKKVLSPCVYYCLRLHSSMYCICVFMTHCMCLRVVIVLYVYVCASVYHEFIGVIAVHLSITVEKWIIPQLGGDNIFCISVLLYLIYLYGASFVLHAPWKAWSQLTWELCWRWCFSCSPSWFGSHLHPVVNVDSWVLYCLEGMMHLTPEGLKKNKIKKKTCSVHHFWIISDCMPLY